MRHYSHWTLRNALEILQILPLSIATETTFQPYASKSVSAFMDDEGRDQLFKADASDEGCLNIHLLITQMESVCLPYDEDRLGTDSAKCLQVWI